MLHCKHKSFLTWYHIQWWGSPSYFSFVKRNHLANWLVQLVVNVLCLCLLNVWLFYYNSRKCIDLETKETILIYYYAYEVQKKTINWSDWHLLQCNQSAWRRVIRVCSPKVLHIQCYASVAGGVLFDCISPLHPQYKAIWFIIREVKRSQPFHPKHIWHFFSHQNSVKKIYEQMMREWDFKIWFGVRV